MTEDKIGEAVKQAEEDAETLQAAIIHGHLAPVELASALAALQRQSLTTVRLLSIVGEGKYVKTTSIKPILAGLYTIGGALVAIAVAVISGKLQ